MLTSSSSSPISSCCGSTSCTFCSSKQPTPWSYRGVPSSWYVLRSFFLGHKKSLKLGCLGGEKAAVPMLQMCLKGMDALSDPAPGYEAFSASCISGVGFGGVWCRAFKQCCQESCLAAARP